MGKTVDFKMDGNDVGHFRSRRHDYGRSIPSLKYTYLLMPRYAPYCLTYSFCQLFGSVSKEHLYPSINYCFFVSYNNIQSSICNSAIWKPMPVPVMFFYRNCIFLVISWDPQERNVYKKTLHFLASTWA